MDISLPLCSSWIQRGLGCSSCSIKNSKDGQQFGWHCDGEIDVKNVAIREFHEESGIAVEPTIIWDIFMADIHDIPLDKKGTPPHKHFDIVYLGIIPEGTPFSRQESEVDDIKWFDIDGIEDYVEVEIFQGIQKIKTF